MTNTTTAPATEPLSETCIYGATASECNGVTGYCLACHTDLLAACSVAAVTVVLPIAPNPDATAEALREAIHAAINTTKRAEYLAGRLHYSTDANPLTRVQYIQARDAAADAVASMWRTFYDHASACTAPF